MEVKETKELIQGLGEVAVLVAKIAKDKKVDFTDLQHVMTMDFTKVIAAADGAALVKEEIEAMNLEQAREVLYLLVDQIAAVKAV